jgi:hypothetical protein
MAISRAQMRSQLTGNKMKKKPVKRKAIGGLLGAMAGEGAMIPLGIIPQMMYKQNKDRKAAAAAEKSDEQKAAEAVVRNRQTMQAASQRAKPMAKGGKVTRGDGACVRGKTKGRYI